jgi:hypothetical protein
MEDYKIPYFLLLEASSPRKEKREICGPKVGKQRGEDWS